MGESTVLALILILFVAACTVQTQEAVPFHQPASITVYDDPIEPPRTTEPTIEMTAEEQPTSTIHKHHSSHSTNNPRSTDNNLVTIEAAVTDLMAAAPVTAALPMASTTASMAALAPASSTLLFYEPFENAASLTANGCVACSVTSFDTGIIGNAALLGAGSTLTYNATNHINKNQGTVSFWVKPVSFNNGATGRGGNGFFDFGDLETRSSIAVFRNLVSNSVYFEFKSDSGPATGQISKDYALALGQWTNIVITYQFNTGGNDRIQLFINGTNVASRDAMNISFNPTDAIFTVGDVGWYERADASMDELKIFDNVRTSTEILNDYRDAINYTPPNSTKPESTGHIKLNPTGLFVDGQSFFINGVGYQPTPIGQNYGYDFFSHPEIYNRDFALLRAMHANTIKPWATVTNAVFLTAAYNGGTDPLYVIMPFYIPPTGINYANPTTRAQLRQTFKDYVTTYKDNPAVLMWAIGNENNLHYTGNITDWYTLVNEMAQDAYVIEGAAYHPVTCINGETLSLGDAAKRSDDASMTYLDGWGINVYRGKTFGTFFGDYSSRTSKPLWLSEYGVDAWHTTNPSNPSQGYEDEESQADWDGTMHDIMQSESTFGGTIMEYADEWNKDWIANDPNTHDYGGYSAGGAHPDAYSNEEWYGVMRTVKNGTNPNIMQPRKAYYTLRDRFRGGNNAPVLEPLGDVTITEGALVTVTAVATDADGDTLTFNYTSPLDANGRWQTTAGDAGTYTVTVTVSDGSASATRQATVRVNAPDTTPPAPVTGLVMSSKTQSSIGWSWNNPSDPDFLTNLVYIDGAQVATTAETMYTANGLGAATTHTITIHTKDASGNVNPADVSDTQTTLADTTPPGPVTGLTLTSKTQTTITWTWTNPTDTDFSENIITLDGTQAATTPGTTYTATNFGIGTTHTITIHTKDTNGNINTAGVSDTRTTDADTTPPAPISGLLSPSKTTTTIVWQWTNPPDADFLENLIFLDGTHVASTADNHHTASGLGSSTTHTITVNTKDVNGNVNPTDVSDTRTTDVMCTDSDGGQAFSVAGRATTLAPDVEGRYDCCKLQYSTNMGDSVAHRGPGGGLCVSRGPYLYEAICASDIPTSVVHACNCVNGACV